MQLVGKGLGTERGGGGRQAREVNDENLTGARAQVTCVLRATSSSSRLTLISRTWPHVTHIARARNRLLLASTFSLCSRSIFSSYLRARAQAHTKRHASETVGGHAYC